MTLTWTRPRTIRRTAAGLALGGALGGALAPALAALLGPAGPGVGLALAICLGGALLRGGSPPAGLLVALVGLLGGLGALLDAGSAPAGLGHALVGLSIGLALGRPGAGAGRSLLESLPHAAGALLGGIAAGALLAAPALVGTPVAGLAAVVGLLVGAGIGVGELGRGASLTARVTPAWATKALAAAGPDARPLVATLLDAHARLLAATRGAPAESRRQSEELGQDLLRAGLAAAAEVERASRALQGLQAEDPALAGHAELARARAELARSLQAGREAAREQACSRAAELVRMVVAISARVQAAERDRTDLETRLREIERAGLLEANP